MMGIVLMCCVDVQIFEVITADMTFILGVEPFDLQFIFGDTSGTNHT